MATQTYELKPRGYGGILDATFDLYKQNFLLFVGIAGIVYIPLAIVQALMLTIGGQTLAMAAAGVIAFVSVFLALFVSGAMTKAIADVYLGQEASVAESYSYVLRRWLPYLWTNILSLVLVMLGIILCFVPGVVFAFWIVFASEVFVIEGKAGWQAIQRSRELVGGHWGRAFVLLFLVGILVAVLQTGPTALIGALLGKTAAGHVLSAAWQGLSSTVVAPIQMIALILLYYDIRIRKEAFDLQVLAEHMAEWGATPSPRPAPVSDYASTSPADFGTASPTAATCASCGRPLQPEAAICEHCGQPVEKPPA